MSRTINYNERMGKAIADKIQKLFSNTDNITEFNIRVDGSTTTAIKIRYIVEEYIIPEEDKENENQG